MDLQTEIVAALNQVIEVQKRALELQEGLLRQSMNMTNQLFGALHYMEPAPVNMGGENVSVEPPVNMETIMETLRPEADKDILGGD